MAPLPINRLVHADWSTAPGKRWAVQALRSPEGWSIDLLRNVASIPAFVDDLFVDPQPTLAGFDFPIGLPAGFGRNTGLNGFCEALEVFGTGAWSHFYDVVEHADDISLNRPFYPRLSSAAARQAHLLRALRVDGIDSLRRQCERKTDGRRAACSIFWTLGGNQVGKAAISGWRDVVQPARQAGALLWPFDGTLATLAEGKTLILCETYPAEAYGHVGIRFGPGKSKRRQDDRREAAAGLASHCVNRGICLGGSLGSDLTDGFGSRSQGEDRFDAFAGLLGMIEVVDGRRAAAPSHTEAPGWEGWILGQAA